MGSVTVLKNGYFETGLKEWHENQKSPKLSESRSFRLGANAVANCAGDPAQFTVNLAFAESVFASWPTRA